MARVSTEARLEKKFVQWCKDKDIIPIKGPSHLAKGFPDRFIQLPNGGGSAYIEFKGTSVAYDLTPMQVWWKEYLTNSNPNRYFVVENKQQLTELFEKLEVLIGIGVTLVGLETKLIKSFNKVK